MATQYGLNPKTAPKWRKRSTAVDATVGPKPRSSVLTEAEEAIVVEFRRRTLLPLDDVLGASSQGSGGAAAGGCLRDAVPKLTRSAFIAAWSVTASPDSLRQVALGPGRVG